MYRESDLINYDALMCFSDSDLDEWQTLQTAGNASYRMI